MSPAPLQVFNIIHQIIELRMCALSYRIREKPNWWKKVKDPVIVEQWREEALRQDEETDSMETGVRRYLTPAMVRFQTSSPSPRPYSDI